MVSRLGFFCLFGWGWSGGRIGAVGLDLLAWRNLDRPALLAWRNLEETGSLESTSPLLNPAFQPSSLPSACPQQSVVVPVSAASECFTPQLLTAAQDNRTCLLLCLCPLGLLARDPAHLADQPACPEPQSGYLTSPASPQD